MLADHVAVGVTHLFRNPVDRRLAGGQQLTGISMPALPRPPITHQLVPTSEMETSSYFGSSNARLSDREMLPMFWINNGIQYGAFLIFGYSKFDK
jgi:hypothetical protein